MKLRNLLLIGATLPLLGACVAYNDPYYGDQAYYNNAPAYYDAYPSSTYIEYNQSYGHRGGYRENYWAHDRAREDRWRQDREDHRSSAPRSEHQDGRAEGARGNRPTGWSNSYRR